LISSCCSKRSLLLSRAVGHIKHFHKRKLIRRWLKILVTGGTGFVGLHIVDLFLEKSYKVKYNLGWMPTLRLEEGLE
jgi:hypothetical protein